MGSITQYDPATQLALSEQKLAALAGELQESQQARRAAEERAHRGELRITALEDLLSASLAVQKELRLRLEQATGRCRD